MTALVVAEHDNIRLKGVTAKAVSAALQIDKSVHVLVAGANCRAVA